MSEEKKYDRNYRESPVKLALKTGIKASEPVRNEGTVRNSRLQRTAASAVAPKYSGNKICIGVL